MNILILGAGGREHALAWKLSQSPLMSKLFVAPGNAGTADLGKNIDLSPEDFPAIKEAVKELDIRLVVVGPEAPLVSGVHDFFLEDPELRHIPVIGPPAEGAQLEGSKDFAKQFMQRHGIPTAKYFTVTPENLEEGKKYLEEMQAPYVLKADGLAAGKGVLIIDDLETARNELVNMIDGKFGTASSKVVLEEFLEGIELSVFILTDGENYLVLPEAKDYKRIGEGDTGLNTGGMGAVSPVPFADKQFMEKVEDQVIIPTVTGLKAEGIPYSGFIFFGLINVNGNPYVIEYNARMGDPEAEVVLPRIKTDLLDLFFAVAEKKLGEKVIEFEDQVATTVMLVSGGYPGSYEKGKQITGIDYPAESLYFHAGTRIEGEKIVSSGGRVIAVTSYGNTMSEALEKSYKNAEYVQFESKHFRKDIGFDL